MYCVCLLYIAPNRIIYNILSNTKKGEMNAVFFKF